MFNSGGVEVEVAEFLYALVRLVKPRKVLETGTHCGISSSYIGLALQDNAADGLKGDLITLEMNPVVQATAKAHWHDLGIDGYVAGELQSSLEYEPDGQYEMLFLDSEPHLRFDEFTRFWPALCPGGFVLIHDLHQHLGHSGNTINGMYDWPFGDFRTKIGDLILQHDVQTLCLPTPRGLVLFQKASPGFGATNLLTGAWKDSHGKTD